MAQLTPDQRQRLIERYAVLGSFREVAREIGCDEKTVRRVIGALDNAPRKADLHARACEAGVREGRKAVRAELQRFTRYSEAAVGDGSNPACEPRDYAALVRAMADLNRVMLQHDERVTARKIERLSRDLTRERIKALRGLDQALAGATDEELATVQTILERAKRRGGGSTQGDRDGAGTTEPLDAPTGEPR